MDKTCVVIKVYSMEVSVRAEKVGLNKEGVMMNVSHFSVFFHVIFSVSDFFLPFHGTTCLMKNRRYFHKDDDS